MLCLLEREIWGAINPKHNENITFTYKEVTKYTGALNSNFRNEGKRRCTAGYSVSVFLVLGRVVVWKTLREADIVRASH